MDYDDWMFDSIKMYKNLSMYDLQDKVTAMDLVEGKCLYLATSSTTKNQIMELTLPDKMIEDEEKGKLKKDRDFHVNAGGFCSDRVTELKKLLNSRCCAVHVKGQGHIGVWEMGSQESDLVREVKVIPASLSDKSRVHLSVGTNQRLAYATHLRDVGVVDLENCKHVFSASENGGDSRISSLVLSTSNDLLMCTTSGNIYSQDIRGKESSASLQHSQENTASDIYWTMSVPSNQSNSLLQLSSSGDVVRLDTRNLQRPVCCQKLKLKTNKNYELLSIQQSPKGDKFSVSGFDGNVRVFKPSVESTSNSEEPIFIHQGHVMDTENHADSLLVVKHIWHPWQQDMIISTATDASLHVWQYSS